MKKMEKRLGLVCLKHGGLGTKGILVSVLLFAVVVRVFAASEVYVAIDGDGSSGADWAHAYTNIQTALDGVDTGGTVHLKGETFTLTNQLTWAGATNVTVRGSYEGDGAPGAFDYDRWPTVIEMERDTGQRVIYIERVTNAVIESVCITGGNTTGETKADMGGGLLLANNPDGSLILRGCVVSNNTSYYGGGGIAHYLEEATPNSRLELLDCIIITNSVPPNNKLASGGGVYTGYTGGSRSGNLLISNCQIRANSVIGGDSPYGAGVYCNRVPMQIYNTTFADNWLAGARYCRGGAISVSAVGTTVVNCIFSRNRCLSIHYGSGGGIYLSSSFSTTIRNSLFHDNEVYGPSAMHGAAITTYTGNKTSLENCTLHNNLPSGIAQRGPMDFENTILWGNGEEIVVLREETLVFSHSNIETGDYHIGAEGCISEDPLFLNPSAGNYALSSLSPCREAGVLSSWIEADTLDLAGNPRVMPRRGQVDMGAYEGLPQSSTMFQIR